MCAQVEKKSRACGAPYKLSRMPGSLKNSAPAALLKTTEGPSPDHSINRPTDPLTDHSTYATNGPARRDVPTYQPRGMGDRLPISLDQGPGMSIST